jgi:hypothetical protein
LTNDTRCERPSPPGIIAPRVACEWRAPATGDPFPNHKQVLATPAVADFDFDDHRRGDTPTRKPSIVIPTYDALDGACGLGPMSLGANYGILRVLDGRTCEEQFILPTHVNGSATPALGDLDGDGHAEIVTLSATGGVVAFRFDPDAMPPAFKKMWDSHTADGMPSNPFAGRCMWTGVTIADLDDDGHPEIIAEGYVYDATGMLLDATAGLLNDPPSHGTGQFPVIADVDGDGTAELVSARRLLRWNRNLGRFDVAQTYANAKGYVAVADLGTVRSGVLDRSMQDGVPEIIIVVPGAVKTMTLDGTVVFGPIAMPSSTGGGPPTVGDFDGDGRAEIAAAGSDSYTIFDPDCVAGASTAACASARTDGILWTKRTQDHSSNITGSSVFDFEGDGTAEAVYADECFTRIFNGRTGEVLFSQPRSSCTWNEYPIVADIAGTFRARLAVGSNENCNVTCPATDDTFAGLRCRTSADCPNDLPCDEGLCRCTTNASCNTATLGGGFECLAPLSGTAGSGNVCRAVHSGERSGVRVFADAQDRWAGSRAIWNQHAYSVTNVDDEGGIPRTSEVEQNWRVPGLNNFRQNVQGDVAAQASPDLTVRLTPRYDGACSDNPWTLSATVCNRGASPAPDAVRVRFEAAGSLACTATTTIALGPSDCTIVSCAWAGGRGGILIRAAADDAADVRECEEANNHDEGFVSCRND